MKAANVQQEAATAKGKEEKAAAVQKETATARNKEAKGDINPTEGSFSKKPK